MLWGVRLEPLWPESCPLVTFSPKGFCDMVRSAAAVTDATDHAIVPVDGAFVPPLPEPVADGRSQGKETRRETGRVGEASTVTGLGSFAS